MEQKYQFVEQKHMKIKSFIFMNYFQMNKSQFQYKDLKYKYTIIH